MNYVSKDGVILMPQEVVQRNHLPAEYQHASLHDSLKGKFDPLLWEIARDFFADWPQIDADGSWMLLTGTSGKGKTWTAAAVVNELQRVYGTVTLSVEWFPLAWKLPMIFDHYHFRRETAYRDLLNRVYESDIVVFDDLLHVAEFPRSKEFVFGALDYRAQHKLPTIITANAEVTQDDWSDIEKAFNVPFVRRIRSKASGYIAVV